MYYYEYYIAFASLITRAPIATLSFPYNGTERPAALICSDRFSGRRDIIIPSMARTVFPSTPLLHRARVCTMHRDVIQGAQLAISVYVFQHGHLFAHDTRSRKISRNLNCVSSYKPTGPPPEIRKLCLIKERGYLATAIRVNRKTHDAYFGIREAWFP